MYPKLKAWRNAANLKKSEMSKKYWQTIGSDNWAFVTQARG